MIQSEAMNEANEVDAGRDRAVGGGQIRIFVFNEAKRGPTRTPAVPDPESIAAQVTVFIYRSDEVIYSVLTLTYFRKTSTSSDSL